MALIKCPECTKEFSDQADACPNCGYPVKKDSKKKYKVFFIIPPLLVILIIIIFISQFFNHKKEGEYLLNCKNYYTALSCAVMDAEDSTSMIYDVWNDTIFKEFNQNTYKYTRDDNSVFYDDFNEALKSYFSSSEFSTYHDLYVHNQKIIEELFEKASDPPKEYEELYTLVYDSYYSYQKLSDLSVNPKGNLQNYVQSFNELDSEMPEYLKKIEAYTSKYVSNENGDVKDKEFYLVINNGIRKCTYTGPVKNGLPNGKGKMTAETPFGYSWTYEGDLVDGLFDGYGKSVYSTGSVYEGEYKNGYQHGQGKYVSSSGQVDEGTFEDGTFIQ